MGCKIQIWVIFAGFGLLTVATFLNVFLFYVIEGSTAIDDTIDLSVKSKAKTMVQWIGSFTRMAATTTALGELTATPSRTMALRILHGALRYENIENAAIATDTGVEYKLVRNDAGGFLFYERNIPGGVPCVNTYTYTYATRTLSAAVDSNNCTYVRISTTSAYQSSAAVVDVVHREAMSGQVHYTLGKRLATTAGISFGAVLVQLEASVAITVGARTSAAIVDVNEGIFIAWSLGGSPSVGTEFISPANVSSSAGLIGEARSTIASLSATATYFDAVISSGDLEIGVSDFVLPRLASLKLRLLTIVNKKEETDEYNTEIQTVTIPCSIAFVLSTLILAFFAYRVRQNSNELDLVVEQLESIADGTDLGAQTFDSIDKAPKTSMLMKEFADVQEKFLRIRRALMVAAVYIPKEVVADVMITGQLTLDVMPMECAILFVDIDGFTAICDRLNSDELGDFLEHYFDMQSSIIVRNGGTIDKFMGDMIMAMWGAPVSVDAKRLRSLASALQLRDTLDTEEHREFFEDLGVEVACRVGVHTGTVSAGNVGCQSRVSYTILGDPVNLSARLQTANRHLGTRILASDQTLAEIPEGIFALRPMGRLKVVGKDASVGVHEILGLHPELDLRMFAAMEEDDGQSVSQVEMDARSVAKSTSSATKYKRMSIAASAKSGKSDGTAKSKGSAHSGSNSKVSSERAGRLQARRLAQINSLGKAMATSLKVCKTCNDEEMSMAGDYASIIDHYVSRRFQQCAAELKAYRKTALGSTDHAAKLLLRQVEPMIRNPPGEDWQGVISLTAK